MFHKIDEVHALPDFMLSVQFSEGVTKLYDMKPLMEKHAAFRSLRDKTLFSCVKVDVGGHGIVWNDNVDLSCDELWEHGTFMS